MTVKLVTECEHLVTRVNVTWVVVCTLFPDTLVIPRLRFVHRGPLHAVRFSGRAAVSVQQTLG